MKKRGRPQGSTSVWTERRIKALIKALYEYCDEASKRSAEVVEVKKGIQVVGPKMPSLEEFLFRLKKRNSLYIYELAKKWPGLMNAIQKLKDIQKHILITMTLQGAYQQTFAIFAAKNILEWKDTPLIDQSQHSHVTYVWENNQDSVPAPRLPKGDSFLEETIPSSGNGSSSGQNGNGHKRDNQEVH